MRSPNPSSAQEFFTAEEVAGLLRVHVKRVQALARGGMLPAVRIGRKWLFPRARLLALLRTPAGPAMLPDAPAPPTRGGRPNGDKEAEMEISARNQLRGRVTAVSVGGVMAEVRVRVGDQDLVSVITRASVERLGIKVGDEVVAIIKSTEIMLGKP